MAKHLSDLMDIINAQDTETGEEFLKLMQPEKYSKIEMGTILEATVGHDLISYYDKKDIGEYLNFIQSQESVGSDVKDFIECNRDEIINKCYDYFEATKMPMVHGNIEKYIEDTLDLDYSLSDLFEEQYDKLMEGFDEEMGELAFDPDDEDEEFDEDPEDVEDDPV